MFKASSISTASKASSLSSASASSTNWQRNALNRHRSNDSNISLGIDIKSDELKITKDGQCQTYRTGLANNGRTGIDPRGVAAKFGITNENTNVHVKYRGPREGTQLLLRGDTDVFSNQLEHLPLKLTHGKAVFEGYRRNSNQVYGLRNRTRPGVARKTTGESINEIHVLPDGDYTRSKSKVYTFDENSRLSKPFSMTQLITFGGKDHPETYLETLAGHPEPGPAAGSILSGSQQIKRAHREKARGGKLLANAKAVGLKTGKEGTRFRVERKVGASTNGTDKLVSELPAGQRKFLRKAGIVDSDDPKHSKSVFRNILE
jgi:hypothetical protein